MKPNRSNIFKCLSCDLRPEFGPLEMLDHIEDMVKEKIKQDIDMEDRLRRAVNRLPNIKIKL